MHPKIKFTFLASALAFSLAFNISFAIGHFVGFDTRQNTGDPLAFPEQPCLLDNLKLDARQKEALAEMRRAMHEKRVSFWQRANQLKTRIAEMISAQTSDREALKAQLDLYAQNQAAMQHAVAEHLLRVSAMLRPDQREDFQNLLRTEMFQGIRAKARKADGRP